LLGCLPGTPLKIIIIRLLGRNISRQSDDDREASFLFQRLSILTV